MDEPGKPGNMALKSCKLREAQGKFRIFFINQGKLREIFSGYQFFDF